MDWVLGKCMHTKISAGSKVTLTILSSFHNSIFLPVTPVYIAEIAPRELRGRLVSGMFVLITTGILVSERPL